MEINVDLNTMDTEFCVCGCPYFRQRTIIKRIPGLLAGAGGKDTFANVEFMACERCGRPHRATMVEVPKAKAKTEEADEG